MSRKLGIVVIIFIITITTIHLSSGLRPAVHWIILTNEKDLARHVHSLARSYEENFADTDEANGLEEEDTIATLAIEEEEDPSATLAIERIPTNSWSIQQKLPLIRIMKKDSP